MLGSYSSKFGLAHISTWGCVVVMLLTLVGQVTAQDKVPAPAPPQPPLRPTDFPKLLGQWKSLTQRAEQIGKEYETAGLDQKKALMAEMRQLDERAMALQGRLGAAAEVAYTFDPNRYQNAGDVLIALVAAEIRAATFVGNDSQKHYARAAQLAGYLIDGRYPDPSKQLMNFAAVAAVGQNDLLAAEKYLLKGKEKDTLEPFTEAYLREIQARRRDVERKDCPQVLLRTTKGDIYLQLYEEEAPNTVANFISLVEQKFYDGLTFHRVIEGFMAQGGDPEGTGRGGPGYRIPCECHNDVYRVHFAYSVSMAHAGRDTGGSQFFITFRPTPHLDGVHTVFGRVIKGQEIVDQLQSTEGTAEGVTPDKIIMARVLRKRDHKYEPRVLAQRAESITPPNRR